MLTSVQIPSDERVEQLRDEESALYRRKLPTPPSSKPAAVDLPRAPVARDVDRAPLPPPRPKAVANPMELPSPPRVDFVKGHAKPSTPPQGLRKWPVESAASDVRQGPPLSRASGDPGSVKVLPEQSGAVVRNSESPGRTQTPPKASAGSHRKIPAAPQEAAGGGPPPAWTPARKIRSGSPVAAPSPPPQAAPELHSSTPPKTAQRSITEKQQSSEKLSAYEVSFAHGTYSSRFLESLDLQKALLPTFQKFGVNDWESFVVRLSLCCGSSQCLIFVGHRPSRTRNFPAWE